ncbi:signal transduction histidine kinase [Streptomyces umbrinus]|uniref:histidine kinase n=1 Tax=Streptomyces umbrinus TaxID=67370 RepID=A0ABU0SWL6_9ACTN|nr:histidine kinase [Streptomyces umbrinus]MDQ1027940.1 signal transduction histidine kinase [Streptomyces umbrinus]
MIDVRQAWRGRPGLAELAVATAAVALTVLVARAQRSGLSVYPQIGGGAPASLLEEVLPFHWALTGLSGIQPFAWAHTGSGSLVPLLACAALGLRRRRPAGLAVALIVLSTGWPVVVPLLIALFTVATMCPARTAWAVTAAALVPVPVALLLAPYPPGPLILATAVSAVTLVAGAVGWGLVVVGLRERAVRAETEATLRAEQARQHAREEIAREMHDVLAHRLSLLTMHAGALEYAPGAPPEQLAEAVGVIRHSATRALEDLQDVLKVLRAPVVGDHTEPPQPTRVDVAQLIAESRAAGVELHLRQRVDDSATMSPALARTAYRLLQEALTNHRKHAPGAPVTLVLEGGPATGLTIQVTNPLEPVAPADPARDSARAPGQGPTQGSVPNSKPNSVPGPVGDRAPSPVPGPAPNVVPGSGQGLIGMRERVDLAGGRLRHRTTPTDFHLDVWLPWTA